MATDPVRKRFAEDHGMPIAEVEQLVALALKAGKCNEHACNGDGHPAFPNASDKSFLAGQWKAIVRDCTHDIEKLTKPYGFTEVVYTGLGPTLKKGDQWVEVPY
jgi:hypothetical protein